MKKAVYKFHADCGRMGELEGVFISTKQKVDKLIESKIEVYFGEVLGKHSEIYGAIEKEDITFVSDNENVVKVIEENGLTSGFNPFWYEAINFKLNGEPTDGMEVDEIIDELIKNGL